MPFHRVNDDTGFILHFEVIKNILPQNTLFIHGNCASNRWWYPAQEIWKSQSQDKNLKGSMILGEFRGCGQSSTPQNESEVEMHRFANDFLSLVKELNVAPLNLVGHSTGGLIAALMMSKESALFNKALLLDPVGAQGVKFDTSMIAAFEQMKTNKDLVATVIGATIHNNDPQSHFFKNIVVEDAFHAVKAVGHLVLKALDPLDVRAELHKISNEVLVLHGEFDQLLPVQDSKNLATLFKRGKFETILQQGHCWNVENPAGFVQRTNEFLFSVSI